VPTIKLGRLEDGGEDGFLVVTGGSASFVEDGGGFLVVTGGSASLVEDGFLVVTGGSASLVEDGKGLLVVTGDSASLDVEVDISGVVVGGASCEEVDAEAP